MRKGVKPHPNNNDNSSSNTVLAVSVPTAAAATASHPQNQQRFNNRGNHRNNNNRYRGRNSFHPRFPYQQWNQPFWHVSLPWQQQQWSPMQLSTYNGSGALGQRPAMVTPNQAHIVGNTQIQPTIDFAQAFNTMTLTDPSENQWYMDSGATAHLTNNTGTLSSYFNYGIGNSVIVGNGSPIPITSSGSVFFPSKSRSLSLTNVLVTPLIIKNLSLLDASLEITFVLLNLTLSVFL